MSAEIVKVQRSLSSSAVPVPGRCLVYGRGHKNAREQAVPAEVWNLLVYAKGYFHATWDEANGGSWDITEPAPWQDW